MPLLLKKELKNNEIIAVWEKTEDDSFFLEDLKLSKKELKAYDEMREHRQKEWITSRYLLHYISDDIARKEIIKDSYGKPLRKNCHKHIAISHSKNRVAVAISFRPIGIDIQRKEERISRIQHKFVSSSEFERIPEIEKDSYYHIFWGAKESMYKAYGKKELAFKENMHVYPFVISESEMELVGWVRKDKIEQDYILHFQMLDDYYLVYSLLNNEK